MNKEKTIKVGVFDSGIGGKSVARYLESNVAGIEAFFREDSKHLPYGDKPMDEVLGYVLPILKKMEAEGCRVIVVACNTVTTNLIEVLRREVNIPLIGMEPMVKPAAKITKTGTIAVCATPATLASKRYKWLLDNYAGGLKVVQPDCSNWTRMIETNRVDREYIRKQIEDVCKQGADVIVLGCTHYHWIEEDIKEMAEGRAQVIQPEQYIAERLQVVLESLS